MRHLSTHALIRAGHDWHWEIPFVDPETGDPFNFATATGTITWTLVLRNKRGGEVVTLSSTPGADGLITADADGAVTLEMTAAATAELPRTRTFITSSDPRVAGQNARGVLYGTLVAVDSEVGSVATLDLQITVAASTLTI